MVDVWFKQLGFSRNPFSIKPAAFTYELFGVNSDSLISGIEDGKMLFVEAPIGFGKTTLLKSIVHRFGGKNKVVYAHALPSEKLDVKDFLKRASLANYITGTLAAGMILVVDEAQNIVAESSAEIMELYKAGNIRAVVFFGTRYSREAFASELGHLLNGNVIRLARPTPEQAVSLIRSRIGNLPVLSNNAILWAYKKAQGSPRQLLQVCEDICRSAVEKGRFSVSEQEFASAPRHEVASREPAKPAKPAKPARAAAKIAAASQQHAATAITQITPELVTATSPSSISRTSTASLTLSDVPSPELLNQISFKKPSVSVKRRAAAPKPVVKAANQARDAKPKVQAKKPSAPPKAAKSKASKQASHSADEPKKSRKQSSKASKPAEAAEAPPEGSYWGEFMGMQK